MSKKNCLCGTWFSSQILYFRITVDSQNEYTDGESEISICITNLQEHTKTIIQIYRVKDLSKNDCKAFLCGENTVLTNVRALKSTVIIGKVFPLNNSYKYIMIHPMTSLINGEVITNPILRLWIHDQTTTNTKKNPNRHYVSFGSEAT